MTDQTLVESGFGVTLMVTISLAVVAVALIWSQLQIAFQAYMVTVVWFDNGFYVVYVFAEPVARISGLCIILWGCGYLTLSKGSCGFV